jgi:membrane fusion protein (multidrug efflux system)
MKRTEKFPVSNASISLMVFTLFTVLLFSPYCTRQAENEAKNIEQIYKEEGIPIKTEIVAGKEFKTELSFNAVLKGIKESPVFAAVGEKIEKIYVKVGDYVKKDTVLLSFPTDTPHAMYFQAKVAFENAEVAYKRLENLYKSGGISLQDRDNAGAAYEVAKANWNTAKQTVKVKAPISGYVTKVGVSETENVPRDTELFTISNTGRMKAYIWISEDQIFAVKTDMTAAAVWQGYKIEGEVVQVDMAMNPEKNAFRALVEFDNPENLLKAGTTVEIKILTSHKPSAIVVKRQYIIREQGKSFVYIVEDGKAKKQEIKTGKLHVIDVEVLEGLNPGAELVVEGQLLLEPDSKVKVIK